VQEVLMQTAVYCGIPAALDSFRVAQQVFNEQDAQAK
jgi:4-carboxymuconolactone decarboxylase